MTHIDTLKRAVTTMRRDVPALPDPYLGDARVWLREASDMSTRIVHEHYEPDQAEVSDMLDWCDTIRTHAGLEPIGQAVMA